MPTASTDAVTSLVRAIIIELWKGSMTLDAIANLLGLSKAQVTNIKNGRAGAGPDTELAVARLRYGGSVDKLRDDAHERARARGGADAVIARQVTDRDDRYPSRGEWLTFARGAKLNHDVLSVIAKATHFAEDPGFAHWGEWYTQLDAKRRAVVALRSENEKANESGTVPSVSPPPTPIRRKR